MQISNVMQAYYLIQDKVSIAIILFQTLTQEKWSHPPLPVAYIMSLEIWASHAIMLLSLD